MTGDSMQNSQLFDYTYNNKAKQQTKKKNTTAAAVKHENKDRIFYHYRLIGVRQPFLASLLVVVELCLCM